MATITPITFTEDDVHALAGERSFRRGQGYLGSVEGLAARGNRVVACVRGTEDYQVVLTLPDADGLRARPGGLRGECDCPQGREGFFCKHCVAVALTVLQAARSAASHVPPPRRGEEAAGQAAADEDAAGEAGEAGAGPDGDGPVRSSSLVSWLNALSRDELLYLMLGQILEDDEWRRRLELRAATAAGNPEAVFAGIAELLDATEFAPYGYVEEGDAARFARRLRDAAEIVEDLVDSGLAEQAAEVAEYAIATVAVSCRDARDPSGVIDEAAEELAASHLEACEAAPPDPAELAGFLAERALSPDDIPDVDFSRYLDLLGPAGLAELRQQFAAAAQANPAGWREQAALERLLRVVGDTDGFVAVLSARLDDHGGNHLRIATELDRAGRADEALAWAERGLREARYPGDDLASYVVQRYWSAGRHADALKVRRDGFAAARDLASYQQLRAAAQQAGDWPDTRQWALGLLRAGAASGGPGPQPMWWAADCVLVDVLVDDGDLTGAWEAAKGHASEEQWLRLADLVAETRPADALAVYLRQIEPLRKETGDRAYRRMARLLVSARACHHRLGTDRVFSSYLRALRAEQKRKRKLLAILDAQGLRELTRPAP